MKSLSEIETTSKRASKAVGFSWGEAEEIAKGVRLLEFFGFPGVKNLNHYFEKKKKMEAFESLTLINENNKSKKFPFCPIILGISFLDQIKNMELLKKVKFQGLAYPILFLSFLSRGSEIIGKRIFIKIDENEFLLNFNISISSNLINEIYPFKAKNIEVRFLENKDNFNEFEWKNLYELSEETFVEESDSLKKSAAGAGLTDND